MEKHLIVIPGRRPEIVKDPQQVQVLIELYKLTPESGALMVELSFLALDNHADLETDLKAVCTLSEFCCIFQLVLC